MASLCWRARTAVSSLQASAARTPRTLLAAICSPLPDPPIDDPEAALVARPPPRLPAGRRPGSRRAGRMTNGPWSTGSCPCSRSHPTRWSLSSRPAWSEPRCTRMAQASRANGRAGRPDADGHRRGEAEVQPGVRDRHGVAVAQRHCRSELITICPVGLGPGSRSGRRTGSRRSGRRIPTIWFALLPGGLQARSAEV